MSHEWAGFHWRREAPEVRDQRITTPIRRVSRQKDRKQILTALVKMDLKMDSKVLAAGGFW
jgi:hypothetical protein